MDLGAVYARWVWCRALPHRAWWLVTSVYLVVDAHLTAGRHVLIGVAQAGVGQVFEVPAGVLADTVSRKCSLVVSHLLMGAATVTPAGRRSGRRTSTGAGAAVGRHSG